MKVNIKIVFKDDNEFVFGANNFEFGEDGFCRLNIIDGDRRGLMGCVAMSEIKYLKFIGIEDDNQRS